MKAVNAATLEYTKTRKQFGQPIAKFQVLQHRMADMFLHAEQATSMSYLAAIKCVDPDAGERRRALSAAKVAIGQAGRFVGQQAIQLHGGMGMTDELIVSHYFKRLTAIDLTFGDTDFHTAAVHRRHCRSIKKARRRNAALSFSCRSGFSLTLL